MVRTDKKPPAPIGLEQFPCLSFLGRWYLPPSLSPKNSLPLNCQARISGGGGGEYGQHLETRKVLYSSRAGKVTSGALSLHLLHLQGDRMLWILQT